MPGRRPVGAIRHAWVGSFGKRTDLAADNRAGVRRLQMLPDGGARCWSGKIGCGLCFGLGLFACDHHGILRRLALVVLPVAAVSCAAIISLHSGALQRAPPGPYGPGSPGSAKLFRDLPRLVPLGFSMWLAIAAFTCLRAMTPLCRQCSGSPADLGYLFLGDPTFVGACCRPVAEWLPRLEILCLDFGLLLSLYAGYRIALSYAYDLCHALKAFAPWALLLVSLFAAGVWIVLQPMQMRGLSMTG